MLGWDKRRENGNGKGGFGSGASKDRSRWRARLAVRRLYRLAIHGGGADAVAPSPQGRDRAPRQRIVLPVKTDGFRTKPAKPGTASHPSPRQGGVPARHRR